jgi:hypothetical protein
MLAVLEVETVEQSSSSDKSQAVAPNVPRWLRRPGRRGGSVTWVCNEFSLGPIGMLRISFYIGDNQPEYVDVGNIDIHTHGGRIPFHEPAIEEPDPVAINQEARGRFFESS